VKITYLMPVDWMKGKAESAIPGNLVMTSGQTPDLNVLIWEERGFTNPAFNDAGIVFQSKSDSAFGLYKKAMVPAGKIQQNLVLSLDAPMQNGIYMSVFEDQNTNYYQMALSPGTFISQVEHQKILVLIDYEAGNSTLTKPGLIAGLKQRLLADYGPGDSFNIVFSKLRVELANDSWKPITAENLNLALDPLVEESLYSNLPGLFATGFDFIKSTGGSGSLLLVTSSDNFGNYEQANALIKDLKKLQDPLPPIFIADIQDQMLNYYYIGNRYYYGQEYLYVNLSKASGGYYKTLREKSSIQDLLSDVVGSIAGMITAFDMYTAPSDGFCYGRFGSNNMEGLPVNQTLTQVGKFIGQTPFIVYLTGLYQTQPFSHLVQVADEQISQADTMLAKMWHGRYISDLERSDKNNMIIQEILYESLNNRVLSQYSAFLCLEPSDTISVCQSCKDETDLLGIDNPMLTDSAGFIKLYPNPFRDRVTLEISTEKLSGTDDVVIRIFSLTGQVVFEQTQPFTPGKTIVAEWKGTGLNGESVKAGQYIVMVRAGQGVWSRKLIKSE
jgi:Ca-activated chloride channel family protein